MSAGIEHEEFCLPRPDEDRPRIESYRGERSNEHGVVVARPLVQRCLDCGAQTVDGQMVRA